MKTRFITSLTALSLMAMPAFAAKKKNANTPKSPVAEAIFALDTTESKLQWEGRKVTGTHHGQLKFKGGELKVKDGQLVGGQLEVDMTSLTDEDLTDQKSNAQLTGHLKSDDFFSVEKHPVSHLVITEAKPLAKDPDGATHEIAGTLTIKGTAKPIRFPASVKVDGDKVELKGTAKVDRTAYDIRFRSGKFYEKLGDKLIYDDFKLDANVVAKKAQ